MGGGLLKDKQHAFVQGHFLAQHQSDLPLLGRQRHLHVDSMHSCGQDHVLQIQLGTLLGGYLRRATQLQDAYLVDGVPSLGVAGRFFTDGGKAKGMEQALKVVEFLTAKVRAGQ